MAKGDKNKVQAQKDVTERVGTAQAGNLREGMINPTTTSMYNAYQQSIPQAQGDYRDIMDQYKSVANQSSTPYTAERVNYNRSPELSNAMGQYQNFADTGGFSQGDISDMRARGISPIRSIYANAQNEMDRQKNLQGGYAPNMAAATARMRSGTSQQIADQVQNVNAELARMTQQGKQFGTSGLGGLSVQDLQMGQQAQLANQGAGLSAAALNSQQNRDRLNAIGGQASLYGTAPGMSSIYGNQLINSTQNAMGNNAQEAGILQNAFGNQMDVASVPSNFQVGAGRVATGIDYASKVARLGAGIPA